MQIIKDGIIGKMQSSVELLKWSNRELHRFKKNNEGNFTEQELDDLGEALGQIERQVGLLRKKEKGL